MYSVEDFKRLMNLAETQTEEEPVKKKISLKKLFEMPKLKEFKKMPKNSHLMKDGKTIMSGKTHSKTSKIVGLLKK